MRSLLSRGFHTGVSGLLPTFSGQSDSPSTARIGHHNLPCFINLRAVASALSSLLNYILLYSNLSTTLITQTIEIFQTPPRHSRTELTPHHGRSSAKAATKRKDHAMADIKTVFHTLYTLIILRCWKRRRAEEAKWDHPQSMEVGQQGSSKLASRGKEGKTAGVLLFHVSLSLQWEGWRHKGAERRYRVPGLAVVGGHTPPPLIQVGLLYPTGLILFNQKPNIYNYLSLIDITMVLLGNGMARENWISLMLTTMEYH
jgi:hypothetical protein